MAGRRQKPKEEPQAPKPEEQQAAPQPTPEMLMGMSRAVQIGNAYNLIQTVENSLFSSTRKYRLRLAILEALMEEL